LVSFVLFIVFSDLTPPLRNASHSDSTSLASLSSRVKKLEHAREASRERREKEMEMLRNQLKAAQESISVLVKKNDALKAQVESVHSQLPLLSSMLKCDLGTSSSHAKGGGRRASSSNRIGRLVQQNGDRKIPLRAIFRRHSFCPYSLRSIIGTNEK